MLKIKMVPRSVLSGLVQRSIVRAVVIDEALHEQLQVELFQLLSGYALYMSCTEAIEFEDDAPLSLKTWWQFCEQSEYAKAWELWLALHPDETDEIYGQWVSEFEKVDKPGQADFLAEKMLGEPLSPASKDD